MRILRYFSDWEYAQCLFLLAAFILGLILHRRLSGITADGPAIGWLRPYVPIVLVAAACALTRILLNLHFGAPVPTIADETSILLQAEMLAMGHLSLPTHPMADWLESVYVSQRPVYASMYAIGRGAPLALAIFLGLEPWYGIVLAQFVTTIAIFWAGRKYVSDLAAFGAASLYIIKFGTFGFYVTYYSPVMAVLGAVLVAGGYRQFFNDHHRLAGAAVFGLGAFVLILTRPYEGAFFVLPFSIAIAWRLFQHGSERRLILTGIAIVLAFVGAGGTVLAVHNRATTGSALTVPYDLYMDRHLSSPAFVFTPPNVDARPPRSERIGAYLRREAAYYEDQRTWREWVEAQVFRLFLGAVFYIGVPLAPAFLFGLYHLRREYTLLASSLLTAAGAMLLSWPHVHYLAPVLLLVVLCTARGLEAFWQHAGRLAYPARLYGGLGAVSVALLPVIAVAMIFWSPGSVRPRPALGNKALLFQPLPNTHRIMSERLRALPGRDLVIVQNQEPHGEVNLVHNEALIDRSEIVWAVDDGRGNGPLVAYYRDRRVWFLGWRDDEPYLEPLRPAISGAVPPAR